MDAGVDRHSAARVPLMIRALVVDDEPLARQELEVLLVDQGNCEIVASCGNAVEAIKAINRDRPEVLFLDIQMPVIGGFELLSMLDPGIMPHVVFVTAYDEFALKAFEEKTLDYLLKPVDRERLAKTFTKLQAALRQGLAQQHEIPSLARIPCACGQRVKLVTPREVDHVRSDLGGVHVVVPEGEYFTELTLKVLEARTSLVRCHRQYMVNVGHIDEILLAEHGLAKIRTRADHLLPVSRHYLKNLKNLLGF